MRFIMERDELIKQVHEMMNEGKLLGTTVES